jgi:hypothetical protein
MPDFTQDLFSSRRSIADGNTRVGTTGKLWYDSITNSIRISDGHSPGGVLVNGSGGAYTLPTATPTVIGGVQLGANIVATGASIDVLRPTRVSQLENDSNYLSSADFSSYATQTYVTTRGYLTSTALASGNANVTAANSRIVSIDANLGSYQVWANGRISTLDANLGSATTKISNLVTQANANTTALLTGSVSTGALTVTNPSTGIAATINVTPYQPVGTQTWTFRGATGLGVPYSSWINFPDGTNQYTAYPGTSTSLSTFDANLGTLSLGNISTQANLGAYQTFANSRITTIDGNIGAYQTWANVNAATQQTSINNINANVGAYQTWANGRITTLDANLGTATTNISNLVTQANANTAAYLTTYTGNIVAGNASITSNLTVTQSALFRGPYNESSTLSGVFVGNTGTAPGITPRIGFFNGNTQQNWQIDNNAGEFRWFVPGATRLSLYPNGNLNVVGSLTLGGKRAVNGPAFSAYAAAIAQTITSGSQQKVLFQTKDFDTDNCYANSRFTPTVEGYYQLNAEVRLDGATGTGEMMIVIWRNGSEHKRGINQSGTQIASNFWAMQVSSLVYANGTTDYFEIYVQQGSGGNVAVTAVNSPAITWFNGAMLRGA